MHSKHSVAAQSFCRFQISKQAKLQAGGGTESSNVAIKLVWLCASSASKLYDISTFTTLPKQVNFSSQRTVLTSVL